jgi:hypothetical protein
MTGEHQRRARRQEERVARDYGGRRNPGSGSGWVHKNDVRAHGYSFELKTTTKTSYTLRLQDLLDAEANALLDGGREMVFMIEFNGRAYAVISEALLRELIEPGDE